MKATINVPLKREEKRIVHSALAPEMRVTKRASSKVKVTRRGVEILIKASDVTSLRASMNTCLKLLETSLKVIKNAGKSAGCNKGRYNKAPAVSATAPGANDSKAKRSNSSPRN